MSAQQPAAAACALSTARLRLRQWRESDLAPFAALNTHPEVIRHLPKALTFEESRAMVERICHAFERQGFGLWAVERVDMKERPFIGFIGLAVPRFEAAFTPCVEIGWRLAPSHWNQGLATEGARAVVEQAFGPLGLGELVSFTVPNNLASRRVMHKLGMQRNPAEDFDHPHLAKDHPLCGHVLYRIGAGRV